MCGGGPPCGLFVRQEGFVREIEAWVDVPLPAAHTQCAGRCSSVAPVPVTGCYSIQPCPPGSVLLYPYRLCTIHPAPTGTAEVLPGACRPTGVESTPGFSQPLGLVNPGLVNPWVD
jgi:hypothetical protein